MAVTTVDLGSVIGPKGDKGDKGDTGATGAKGATGATGPQGPKGEPGSSNPSIIKLFTSSGSYTLPDGCKYIKVEVIGAGAYASSSYKASCGAYACSYISADKITSPVNYIIGGISYNQSGGNTTFLNITAGGGYFNASEGGTASGGMINISGSPTGVVCGNPFRFGSSGTSTTLASSGAIIITEYY